MTRWGQLLAGVFIVGGRNTVAGFGKDAEAAGTAVQCVRNQAKK
jgi:predicted small secreted protein